MDDRSTLERALDTASTAARSTMGRAVDDAIMVGAIRNTQALLGQLLAEEASATPWACWKSASCELVKWWAARFMSALYIAPKRKHPQKVQPSSPHNETGAICLPDCSITSAALAKQLSKLGHAVEMPAPGKPTTKPAADRSAGKLQP